MLCGILQRLQTAEVDGRLDLRFVASDAGRLDASRERCPPRGVRQRIRQAAILEQRRVDPVCEITKVAHCLLNRGPELAENGLRLFGVGVHQPADNSEIDVQPNEVLLGPVVQIALDPPSLRVGGSHDPGARRADAFGELLALARERRHAQRRDGRDRQIHLCVEHASIHRAVRERADVVRGRPDRHLAPRCAPPRS